MSDQLHTRRLAAILYADVVDYSLHTGEDEEETHQVLSKTLDLIAEAVEKHGGRVVHYAGDAVLAEFTSVVMAIDCAMVVQESLAAAGAENLEERHLLYRIGINQGDIIIDRDDIYGDGVNIAARLESLAEPGGICVSGKVFDEVGNKRGLNFEFMGEHKVKNIERPLRVYKIVNREGRAGPVKGKITNPFRLPWFPLGIAALVAIIVLAAVLGYRFWMPTTPATAMPSIVVLPFANLSNDPSQEYFADGMTEDLTTDLAKIPGLFVISRNSAFTYKGKAVRIAEVAAELDVKYVLEGSVRRVGDRVRINVQLIKGNTDGHLWAEKFDGSLSDVFAMQDKVIARIIEALSEQLVPGAVKQKERPDTLNVAAHDAYLRGLSLYYQRKPEENAQAATYFRRAFELDPGYAAAYTGLAKVYVQAAIGEHAYAKKLEIFWTDGFAKAWPLLELSMVQPNADFHVLRSWLALRKRQWETAISEANQALRLNANDADALEAMAEALIYSGKPQAGIKFSNKAMRQNPTLRGRPLYLIGLAEFALGNLEMAVERINQAILEQPDRKADFAGVLAAAYGELGKVDEARSAFKDFSQGIVDRPSMASSVKAETFANPRYHTWRRVDLAWAVSSYPFAEKAILERLAKGLIVAGAPESVGGYLKLDQASRLNGSEIETLLFGKEINGKNFWISELIWQQKRTDDGSVTHFGDPIHAGLPETATASGRIRNNQMCEKWPALTKVMELCVVIFRVSDLNARLRWGDFVMVTDTGPQPFSSRQ